MTQQELEKYVKDQLDAGVDPQVLRMALETEGLSKKQIDQALVKPHTPVVIPGAALQAPVSSVPVFGQETAPAVAVPVPHRGLSKRLKYILAGVILLLILGGGGAYAYFYFVPNPQMISDKMLTQLLTVNSLDYEGSIKVQAHTDAYADEWGSTPEQNYEGSLEFSGVSDLEDVNNPRASMNLKLNADEYKFDFDVRTLEKIIYFKLNDLAFGSYLDDYDADKFKNQWIKIDPDYIAEQYGLTEEEKDAYLDRTLSPDQINKIKEAYVKYPMVVLGEKLSSEKLDGVNTHHYKYTVNKDNLKKFFIESMRIVFEELPAEAPDYSYLDEMFNFVNFEGGEVWVGKKDYLIRKLTFGVNANRDGSSVRMDIMMQYKNLNKPTQIEAPDSYKDLQQVIEEITGVSLSEAQGKSRDAMRVVDVRQMMTALELYYNDFGKYPGNLTLLKDFLAEIPEPGEPDGDCTAVQNEYVYKPSSNGSNYTLTFCLGADTGGLKPGVRTASPAGLN